MHQPSHTKNRIFILSLQDTDLWPRDTHRLKVRMGEIIPLKWKSKESSSYYNTHIRQNSPNKYYYKRQRWTLENDWGSIQEDIIINVYAPNLGDTSICKSNTKNHKREKLTQFHGGALTHNFHQWTYHPDRKVIRKLRP